MSYARRGVLFTSKGRIDIRKPRFLNDKNPIDKTCACEVCQTYTRSYIAHLMRAHEISGMKLATMHNLWYFNALAAQVRRAIKRGEL